jgi:hypothetical protein
MCNTFFKSPVSIIPVTVFFYILSAFAFKGESAITGKINPAGQVIKVWAIRGSDSISCVPLATGDFVLKVKAGIWKFMIDAKYPYKDVTVDKVDIEEGKTVNIGEVNLEQ